MTDHAQAQACRRCGAPVWVGLDDHRVALVATVDATPIPAACESEALINGATTYNGVRTGNRLTIRARTHMHILGTNPATPIYVAHMCGKQYPRMLPQSERQITAAIDPLF